jgi:hypothetical protein
VGQDEATKKKSPETTNNRPTRGSSEGNTHLPAQISSRGGACHRFRAAPRPARVMWAPAPTSQCMTAPGVPRVTGSGKHLPPGADQLWGHRVSPAQGWSEVGTCPVGSSTHLPAQDSSGGVTCPRSSGPEEKRRANAEDLAEPGRCKATPIRSKRNRAQGAVSDSYRIDPDPIYGRPAVADRKTAVARLGDSDNGGRVAPRRGDEEETPVETQTSNDEDRRQNRSDQRRS